MYLEVDILVLLVVYFFRKILVVMLEFVREKFKEMEEVGIIVKEDEFIFWVLLMLVIDKRKVNDKRKDILFLKDDF